MIKVKKITTGTLLSKVLTAIFNNPVAWKLFPGVVNKINDKLEGVALDRFAEKTSEEKEEFDVAYCVDATGLYTFKKSGIKARKTVYISFEILEILKGSTFENLTRIKQLEKDIIKTEVDLVMIQDVYRRKFLERTLGYELKKVSYLPNSVMLEGSSSVKGRYFRDMFGLDANQNLVLSAGMISESVCSMEIAGVMGSWETDLPVKMIFHERMLIPENRNYYQRVEHAGKGKVLLSLNPLPYEELSKVFTSADIGLAIYSKEHGDNFGIIGSASGKLFQYIKYGLPVIVSDLAGLRELVEDHQMGIVVNSPSGIPAAIEGIMKDYDRFSNNARKAFEDDLNMDLFLGQVYSAVYN
jgi:glycosyltransferase involved in cell wall biosynthesis